MAVATTLQTYSIQSRNNHGKSSEPTVVLTDNNHCLLWADPRRSCLRKYIHVSPICTQQWLSRTNDRGCFRVCIAPSTIRRLLFGRQKISPSVPVIRPAIRPSLAPLDDKDFYGGRNLACSDYNCMGTSGGPDKCSTARACMYLVLEGTILESILVGGYW